MSKFVNEMKCDTEDIKRIATLQASIANWAEAGELREYSRLRLDCELKVQSHDGGRGERKQRCAFVFDKCLLLCKAVGGGDHYNLKDSLAVTDYKAQAASPTSSACGPCHPADCCEENRGPRRKTATLAICGPYKSCYSSSILHLQ